jgi:hypothetical protein
MATGFGPSLPLTRSDEDGHYSLHKTVAAEIKEDFKTLLKTKIRNTFDIPRADSGVNIVESTPLVAGVPSGI